MKIVAITPNQKTDYLVTTIVEGLQLLGCEIIASDIGNGIDNAWPDDVIIKEAQDADHIIVFFGKVKGNRPPKRYLLDQINAKHKVAYVDGSEWTCTAWPEPRQVAEAKNNPDRRRGSPWLDAEMLSKSRWYFKRECYPEDIARGIIPLPFGTLKRNIREPAQLRDIDVLCSFGQVNDGLRFEATQICKRLASEMPNKRFCLDYGMDRVTYDNVLSRSRIVIDAWGGGDCCARIWEAVGVGACVLRQKYNIVIPNDFTHALNIIDYSTAEELENWIRGSFSPSLGSDMDWIGRKGKEHMLRFHTSIARARYLLEMMK
jgi:hypothetical protein